MPFKLPLLATLLCVTTQVLCAQSYTKMFADNSIPLALAAGGFIVPTTVSAYKNTKGNKGHPLFKYLPCALAGAGAYWYAPLTSFNSNDIAKFYGLWAGSTFFADMVMKKLVYPNRSNKKVAKRAFFQALALPACGIATAAGVNYILKS